MRPDGHRLVDPFLLGLHPAGCARPGRVRGLGLQRQAVLRATVQARIDTVREAITGLVRAAMSEFPLVPGQLLELLDALVLRLPTILPFEDRRLGYRFDSHSRSVMASHTASRRLVSPPMMKGPAQK